MTSGGGKATTGGIDFQYSVGAFLMVLAWLRLDLSDFLTSVKSNFICELTFESKAHVDDINAKCESGDLLFFQVKTNLSLSDLQDSKFGKVVGQFVDQHCENDSDSSAYTLVVSSKASSRITRDLRCILDSLRASSGQLDKVTLSRKETETLDKFRSCFDNAFLLAKGNAASDEDFASFACKTFIEVLDLHAGGPIVKATLLLLAGNVLPSPELIWSLLCKSAMRYGSNRTCVTRDSIDELLRQYRRKENSNENKNSHELLAAFIAGESGKFQGGKEVVLIDSPFGVDKFDIIIAEMARFDDAGNRKFEFENGEIINPVWEKPTKVYCRASTFLGVERFIDEHSEVIEDKKLAIIPANFENNPDESPAALAHASMADNHLQETAPSTKCLHCQREINSNYALIIEIDEKGNEFEIGFCHADCYISTNRIVGRAELRGVDYEKYLHRFDLTCWATQMMRGQRGIQDALSLSQNQGRPVPMIYNHENAPREQNAFCIRTELEDGSWRFICTRGRIQRFTKPEAAAYAEQWTQKIAEQSEAGDPYGYTTESIRLGTYSTLLRMKTASDEIVNCLRCEVVKYSKLSEEPNFDCEWYAPLCEIVDSETDLVFALGGSIPLISNPLEMDRFLKNWAKAGIELEDFDLRVISDDIAFDYFVRRAVNDGMQIIVDPILDQNGELITGVVVEEMDNFARHMENVAPNGESNEDE